MKKQFSTAPLFAISFLCILFSLSLVLDLLQPAAQSAASASLPPLPVIILDAGHGGEDGGATGSNGVLEKQLNLSISCILADLLRAAGFPVVQTRTEDKLLYGEGTKKGHKKQGDLENRLQFTKEYPQGVFVSIHMNTFPTAECHGLQVWYSQNHPDSKLLAEAVQSSVKALLQPQNNRRVKAATSSIYILRHAETPAILIECGFLSTPAECELLCDEAYQKSLSLAIFAALLQNLSPGTCENAENAL